MEQTQEQRTKNDERLTKALILCMADDDRSRLQRLLYSHFNIVALPQETYPGSDGMGENPLIFIGTENSDRLHMATALHRCQPELPQVWVSDSPEEVTLPDYVAGMVRMPRRPWDEIIFDMQIRKILTILHRAARKANHP